MKSKIIFTIGHSTRSVREFVAHLQENNIDILVDVRTIPYSRFCPHFNQNALQRALEKENIITYGEAKNLGGKGENVNYEETIDEIVMLSKGGKAVCVMCTEKDYEKCHRYQTLIPSLEQREAVINHIKWE